MGFYVILKWIGSININKIKEQSAICSSSTIVFLFSLQVRWCLWSEEIVGFTALGLLVFNVGCETKLFLLVRTFLQMQKMKLSIFKL